MHIHIFPPFCLCLKSVTLNIPDFNDAEQVLVPWVQKGIQWGSPLSSSIPQTKNYAWESFPGVLRFSAGTLAPSAMWTLGKKWQ